jgi:hypothetical protein
MNPVSLQGQALSTELDSMQRSLTDGATESKTE